MSPVPLAVSVVRTHRHDDEPRTVATVFVPVRTRRRELHRAGVRYAVATQADEPTELFATLP